MKGLPKDIHWQQGPPRGCENFFQGVMGVSHFCLRISGVKFAYSVLKALKKISPGGRGCGAHPGGEPPYPLCQCLLRVTFNAEFENQIGFSKYRKC